MSDYEKVLDPKLVNQSILDNPKLQERESPSAHPFIFTVASRAQSITPWGVNFRLRDKELRSFWPTETWLASVVYSVSVRNASFAWEVEGSDPTKKRPDRTIKVVRDILRNSDRGNGWHSLMMKTCIDLYTQDNGAFWEIIRNKKSPNAPVINIAHLDAGRCIRTGDPNYPVIYTDRHGNERPLRYWEVRMITEMPSPIEEALGIQYSAVSRALLAAEIIQSISVYKQEKVSGTFTKAIDIVSGVTNRDLDGALSLAEEQNLNRGLLRYSIPVIIPGIDPSTTLSHVHIDLASLPDNFNEDTSLKWYVAQLAAAFGVDYQEIAPLMTGNLGSSQQSEIMHLKTRGKGPAAIMSILEEEINRGLIPGNVEFKFKEQDLRSETEKANARFTRAKDRSLRVKSGELDPESSREMAVLDGDLPMHMVSAINRREKEREEEERVIEEQQRQEFQADQIEGGIESQNMKWINSEDIQLFRNKISSWESYVDALDNL